MITNSKDSSTINPTHAAVDLVIFVTVMFSIRQIHFESIGFWGNALLNSTVTVGVATILLYFRGQSWTSLGLIRPVNYLKMIGVAVAAVMGTVMSIMVFEGFIREAMFGPSSTSNGGVNFDLDGSLYIFLSTLFLVWIESFLEELQDRGFSLNRIESLLSKLPIAALIAVVFQATIFGFRHSLDFSPRSVTTGLIGFIFGLVYIMTGRNLWPLIIAHIALNTISVID